MGITWGTSEITILVLIVVFGIPLLLLILRSIVKESYHRNRNPITKLKVNTIYFQDEPDPSNLLLRQSNEEAELKLYKIKGADRTKMPKVFAVIDKDKDIYKIVSYQPTIIGGSSDEFPDKLPE
ncbi:MAG: hypothetical protein ISS88_02380 [Candidatus Portnoybacteria bacterium]|nr:hypothetical protein [Candidatus Portnoybacteria bacterium]